MMPRLAATTGVLAVLALAHVVPSAAPTRPHPRAQGQPAEEAAAAFYLRYRAIVPVASDAAEIVAFWSAAQAREYEDAPPAQRADLAALKRIYGMHTDVTIVREAAAPNGVALALEGTTASGQRTAGSVTIVKEAGAWKVTGPENWAR